MDRIPAYEVEYLNARFERRFLMVQTRDEADDFCLGRDVRDPVVRKTAITPYTAMLWGFAPST